MADTPQNKEDLVSDFSKSMSYGDYLHLDQILTSQHRLSDHHDEMLFIIIHQASELWMKLILHELRAARASIQQNNLEPAFKMLARVSGIQKQLIQSWDVLSTLTPAEYMQFRHKLGNSSGFQSYQNRQIEFMLGLKNPRVLAVYEHQPELLKLMSEAMSEPSIYDAAIGALAARGLTIDPECLQRDWSQPYVENESVTEAWLTVYRDVDQYWDLYELAEKLVDIDSRQQQWRFNHMGTVERVIGFKRGTGGSSGVDYLKHVVSQRYFPELWSLRTVL
ncbi:tryptophan 2,3-dioxygenase [Paenibacillus glycanilyticus]|uniref:Tryptophan 2,3-dioxygenase n=1 Tax=Paenibacillus glycanilyticus TaxID=126569 RepID=A0ABQ6G647_9BACL|nr:tryptophan 2,3-dioxygenase [Paenibacillus glycanilyticus]GLX65738.1 tryptophan 2,3-dioxygenase [Paenibacillus glycanilyticus]